MCNNKYYPAIISPIERIIHEFYVSFVVITWYGGTLIGSFMAIHLHTINRHKSELVLLPAGISFLCCILIETQLTIDSTHYDYFLLRIVSGTLVGVIYLTSIIVCIQNGYCSGATTWRTAYYGTRRTSASICGCMAVALIILLSQTKISIELCCVSLTLIYGLIALNLSHSSWVFGNNVDQQWQWRLHQRRQEFCSVPSAATETVAAAVRPSHVRTFRTFNAFSLIVGKQTRPLIYLAGAKLLTIFCFFLPFICIASRITNHANIVFTDVVDDDNNKPNGNDFISANEDDVSNNNSSIIIIGTIFTDLMVLLLTRIALGSIAILLVRHNVNFLSIVYLIPITIGLAVMLLVPLFDLLWHLNTTVQTITFGVIMTIYVAFSLIVDVIGHHAALHANEMEIGHSHVAGGNDAAAASQVISLTFATFIEHLIDICIVVVYLNDWISAKLIVTSFAIIFLTMIFSQTSASNSEQKQHNSNLITVKYQIL